MMTTLSSDVEEGGERAGTGGGNTGEDAASGKGTGEGCGEDEEGEMVIVEGETKSTVLFHKDGDQSIEWDGAGETGL